MKLVLAPEVAVAAEDGRVAEVDGEVAGTGEGAAVASSHRDIKG